MKRIKNWPFFLASRATLTLIIISCMATTCKKQSATPAPTPAVTDSFAKGADVGWLTEMEAAGVKFYSAAGTPTECMALLKSLGMNSIRLRVWVNPAAGWNNATDVVTKAVRAKNLGMRVMIDFHYSDDWADPGKQFKPAAWAAQDFATLKTSLATHTTTVLNQLKTAGVTPEWVQVGNETNDGMLWPDGRASTNMNNFAQLVNSGYDAVKTVFPAAKVIVHLSNGYNNSLFRWMFDGLRTNGAKYDVIGMSLYPSWAGTGWAVANQDCLNNMNDMISRYNKEVMIVEVGMPWDNATECKNFVADIIAKGKSVANKKCLGVLYWEPQAHNSWKGYTLGAFYNNGKPSVALDAFK